MSLVKELAISIFGNGCFLIAVGVKTKLRMYAFLLLLSTDVTFILAIPGREAGSCMSTDASSFSAKASIVEMESKLAGRIIS